MTLTERGLNRATLARQLLLDRAPYGVVEAVGRLVGLQAQEPASPYLALWNRLAPFESAALDLALREWAVLKATLFRGTLHAVAASDHPSFHAAIAPSLRAGRLADPRFARTELAPDEIDALVAALLDFTATPRSNAELAARLDGPLPADPTPEPAADRRWAPRIPGSQDVWWALRSFAPVVHAPTADPWCFGLRPSYVAAPARPATGDREAHARTLARRYLHAFGPATAPDFAQFSGLPVPLVRAALDALDDLERLDGPGGRVHYDVPAAPLPPDALSAPPRLLGMWDNVLLAYADRGRVLPADYRRAVIRTNGDVLPTLLVDGYVAGVWRPVELSDGRLVIEATAFHPLRPADWEGLELEAAGLASLLAARDRTVYRRYRRWWEKDLRSAEVRRLGV